MQRSIKILIILSFILIAALGVSLGFLIPDFFAKNNSSSSLNTSVPVNITPDNTPNDNSKQKSDVPYRINSNTPNCPNCGSNNIAQIGDTVHNNNTHEYVIHAKCRYCGYEWYDRTPDNIYT